MSKFRAPKHSPFHVETLCLQARVELELLGLLSVVSCQLSKERHVSSRCAYILIKRACRNIFNQCERKGAVFNDFKGRTGIEQIVGNLKALSVHGQTGREPSRLRSSAVGTYSLGGRTRAYPSTSRWTEECDLKVQL